MWKILWKDYIYNHRNHLKIFWYRISICSSNSDGKEIKQTVNKIRKRKNQDFDRKIGS